MTRDELRETYSFSKPVENAALRILSLGAGVQSSVMALLAADGLIGPMPDAAIFADTGWEPKDVYKHLAWLESRLPFPVYRVSAGNIRDDIMANTNTTGQGFRTAPFYVLKPNGEKALLRRQCTKEYKIAPITKKTRDLLGLKPRQRVPKDVVVEQWIGISYDEMQRMKEAPEAWRINRWPLIELGWRRADCLKWFNDSFPGRVLRSSECIGCPFKDNARWRETKSRPEEWADAVEVDRAIREGLTQIKSVPFLHRDCVPLEDANIEEDQNQFDMFQGECDGMCGV